MANIYKQQQTSNLAHKVYSAEGNPAQSVLKYGEQMQKQAQQYEDKAKVTYANALEIESANVMNELINDPSLSANPALLEEKMNVAFDKIAGDIVDDDVKIDFLAKTSVKKSSYLNKAYANAKKVQDEQYKSSLFNSIYANMDGAGLSFMNGLTGNGSMEDVQNFQMYDNQIVNYINTKDEYGSYVFSDEQRLKMAKDYEKSIIDYFKSSYETMDERQKENLLKSFEKDKVSLGVIRGKQSSVFKNPKDIETTIYLNKVVSPGSYADMKQWAFDARDKERRARINEFELSKKEAMLDFIENPTRAGLESIIAMNPGISDRTLEELEDRLLESPNYVPKVEISDLADANSKLQDVLSLPDDDQKQRDAKLVAGLEFVNAAMNKQHSSDFTLEDKQKIVQSVVSGLSDDVISDVIKSLPFSKFQREKSKGFEIKQPEWISPVAATRNLAGDLYKIDNANKRLSDLARNTMSEMLNMAVSGVSKEQIMEFYQYRMKEATKTRYFYVEDLQNPNLKVGDTIYWNGQAYKFNGFTTDDVLLEVQ